jgi:EmrB/QacA subfamily drug resistance transporter
MPLTTSTTTRAGTASLTFLLLAAGAGSFALLQSLVAPVLATIQGELHTSQSAVTWVLTAYLLSASIFTPILGRVGDSYGKKRTLVGVLLTLAAGSLLAALAPSIGVLIVARVIQGAGGAVLPLSFGILRDEFPPARVASAVGAMSAVIGVGGGLGIVLAGPIVDVLGYRWLFWIPMVVVAVAAACAQRFVPESPVRHPGRINWLAAALLSGWLVALLLAVSEAPEWGWGSTRVLGLAIAAVVLLVAWVRTEVRAADPLIDMRMMRLPSVWTTNLAAMLFGASMYAVFAFLPQFVETPARAGYGFGASVTEAGLLLLPMLVTMFFAGIVSGRTEGTFSSKAQLATGSGFAVVACAMLTAAHADRWEIAAATALLGLGIGLAFSSMTNLIVRSVPARQTGVASGMNANFRTIGGAIGAGLMGSLVTGSLQPDGFPSQSGYTDGFLLLTLFSIAAVAAALIVPSVQGGTRTAEDAAPDARSAQLAGARSG